MPRATDLIIIGASARAAAFSALRAGLRPWCADLFADADLRACCPAVRLIGKYPDGFADLLATAPPAPWMYVGGLENHPRLVARLAQVRTLWGNNAAVLTAVRDPLAVHDLLRAAGVPFPRVITPSPPTPFPRSGGEARERARWLVKSLRGSGGSGVRFHSENESLPARCYLQEFVEGESRAAVYAAGPKATRLLGVTRQLVGEAWLNAAPFHYCGNVGPLRLTADERRSLERLGHVLAAGCGLRGLFGVDGVWREGTFWPVEVNPRYTASVEVLEYATGLSAISWHRAAFDAAAPGPSESTDEPDTVTGKAVFFAREPLVVPASGPWTELVYRGNWEKIPAFADVPNPNQEIQARRPVLTFFARAADVSSCVALLRETAARVATCLKA